MKRLLALFVLVFVTANAQTGKVTPVIEAFKTAKLKAVNPRLMEPKEFGFAPKVTDEAYIFGVPQVCSDCNGRIFYVENTQDRKKLFNYYNDMGKSSAILFSWAYEYKNYVLQLNGEMKRAEAVRYKTALESAR